MSINKPPNKSSDNKKPDRETYQESAKDNEDMIAETLARAYILLFEFAKEAEKEEEKNKDIS